MSVFTPPPPLPIRSLTRVLFEGELVATGTLLSTFQRAVVNTRRQGRYWVRTWFTYLVLNRYSSLLYLLPDVIVVFLALGAVFESFKKLALESVEGSHYKEAYCGK